MKYLVTLKALSIEQLRDIIGFLCAQDCLDYLHDIKQEESE